MSEFVFNEKLHRYTLDGEVLPSVTQFLKPLYNFDAVDPGILIRASQFGTAVHKAVELYLLDDLDEDSLDPELYGCLLAFKAFESDRWDMFEETPVVEKIGYHPKLKYAGTPDLDFPSRIIDIKSRKCNPLTDPIQAIMYDHMTGNGKREHYVLELYQDASYVLVPLNVTERKRKESWSRARYLMDYYKMTQEIKLWK